MHANLLAKGMRGLDEGLEIDVLPIGDIEPETVDQVVASIDDGEKMLWESPAVFYNPKQIDP